ncbi:MAG: hypothetical protein HDR02_11295 [Lachnospiraceae bacterium]|nr:hypothetical protein [Lachnospiraceae bacterium]
METILRRQEMAEIKLLPVRHHSPACAWQVQRMIETWHPQAVLIEGPDTASPLIPAMIDPATKAPFAVYYSYDDTAGAVSEEKEKYRCYYPFLDYSPELAALRTGSAQGAKVAFIDLPYGDILAASREGKGMRQEGDKSNYNDDYLLSRNAYLQRLCEKTGLRSFDEFWEKYFELEGLMQDSETWFDNLLTYCRQARESTPQEQLKEEGCLAREAYMAGKILDVAREMAGTSPHRILVVTGGFHTPALAQRLGGMDEEKSAAASSAQADLPRKLVSAKDQGVYLMPYSMEAADALNGYASGMPFPGFYQEIWEHVQAEEQEEMPPYTKAVLDMVVTTGKAVRRAEGSASTYDEICACSMAEGLAALRGKPQPGAYELQDAVLSCFVKGEYNLATDEPMRLLRRQMTGRRVGELCQGAGEPPVLQDFRTLCKRYGLQVSSTLENEVTLSVFGKKKHRQMSMFFHRLLFLQAPYARRVKGPNLQTGRDRNLIREIWKYKWNAQVMAALIDASVYGGTVEEAARGLAAEQLKKAVYAREGALLLSQVLEMGLEGQLEQVYGRLQELLISDTDFYSLAEALRLLTMVQQLRRLYDSGLEVQGMIQTCIRRLLGLLPGMARVKEEDMARCMEAIKLLYQVIGRMESGEKIEGGQPDSALLDSYFDALLVMDRDSEIQAGVHGCIHGLLYGGGRESVTQTQQVCRGYLTGTREQQLKTALFFRGLFFGAKDLVFVGEDFLRMLDEFLMQIGEEDFMQLLPELHMAFTYFTPAETDRIAQTAAGFHGRNRRELQEQQAVPEVWYLYGRELEDFALEEMGTAADLKEEVYG